MKSPQTYSITVYVSHSYKPKYNTYSSYMEARNNAKLYMFIYTFIHMWLDWIRMYISYMVDLYARTARSKIGACKV